MSLPRAVLSALVAVASLVGLARAAVQVPPLSPQAQAAVSAYMRDPAANTQQLFEAARQEGGNNPLLAILAGDAAVRSGLYRTASEYYMLVQDSALASAAELGLGWASLGQGRLPDASEHFAAAASLGPGLQQLTDFAIALISATNGSPDGRDALAAAARASVEPAFHEVAPLLDAYALYWAGDTAAAADAFMAFAVAHPDSRFADDALYGAAQAKLRSGREDEGVQDLEALAGDEPQEGRLPSRLVALDGRALVREGMRRDHDLPVRLLPQRLADLFDGDGVRLAQGALAALHRRERGGDLDDAVGSGAAEPEARAGAGVAAHGRSRRGHQTAGESSGVAVTSASHAPGTTPEAGELAAPAAGSGPRAARFPWTVVFALLVPVVLLGLWLLGRGDRPDQARSP